MLMYPMRLDLSSHIHILQDGGSVISVADQSILFIMDTSVLWININTVRSTVEDTSKPKNEYAYSCDSVDNSQSYARESEMACGYSCWILVSLGWEHAWTFSIMSAMALLCFAKWLILAIVLVCCFLLYVLSGLRAGFEIVWCFGLGGVVNDTH